MVLLEITFFLLHFGSLIIQCESSIHASPMENFEEGKCRRGENDSFVYDMTYFACVEECRHIPHCVSVTMMSQMKWCRLNMDGEDPVETCPLFVFSEKDTWTQKEATWCESLTCEINQKCVLTESSLGVQCANRECNKLSIENGLVLGNDVQKRKKVAFICNDGYRLVGKSSLTCQEDFTWDGEEPICECIFEPLSQTLFGYPDFESEWTVIEAQQGVDSVQHFYHDLGEVPGLVEVLVKPEDGPYEGFIFKATGNGNRDDDVIEKYGGVVYIYNEEAVIVTVPTVSNSHPSGYAMYMGDRSEWSRGAEYESRTANVMVRCWLRSNMPEPCFTSEEFPVESGINSNYPTFIEIPFNTCTVPEMVSVRVKLTNGQNSGWYSDGQGTSRFLSTLIHIVVGGVIYGFNEDNIRVWIYSSDRGGQHLFNAADGWGLGGISTRGILDARVWCKVDNPVYAYESFHITPAGVGNSPSEVIFTPTFFTPDMDLFAYVTIRALEGPNAGYRFIGIDAAMSPISRSADVCTYGGLIYCYSPEKVNLRWPSQPYGAAVCIPNVYGNGTNTGKVQRGNVMVKLWTLGNTFRK